MARPVPNVTGDTLPTLFQKYRPHIDAALRNGVPSDDLSIYLMLRYAMGWSDADGNPGDSPTGKGLRPTLCLQTCEASGGTIERALPAAASLELIHNFSLIHDDIQDRDETRHHRPTLWSVWGDPKALVAGNALRVLADQVVGDLTGAGVPHDVAVRVTALLTAAYLEMIEGQYLDLAYETRTGVTLDDYLQMISRKTGALIRCSAELGAVIGSGEEETVKAMGEWGRALGFVFQIRDDYLGVWGKEEETGKPVGADIRRRKKTYPVVHAMSNAEGAALDRLTGIYSQDQIDDSQVDVVMDVMEGLDTRKSTQALAARHCEEATYWLSTVEFDGEAKRDMEEVAQYLLVRER